MGYVISAFEMFLLLLAWLELSLAKVKCLLESEMDGSWESEFL